MAAGSTRSAPDSIASEAAAWRAQQAAVREWPASRGRCALWGTIPGPLIAVVTWIVVSMRAEGGAEGYDGSWALPAAAIGFVVGILLSVELLVLAIRGGGFKATTGGLAYRLGVVTGVVPWADLAETDVEGRTNAKGGAYTVLAIHLRRPGRRWPPSVVLWGSTRDVLCVTPYVFAGPTEAIARGIDAARAAFASSDEPEG